MKALQLTQLKIHWRNSAWMPRVNRSQPSARRGSSRLRLGPLSRSKLEIRVWSDTDILRLLARKSVDGRPPVSGALTRSQTRI